MKVRELITEIEKLDSPEFHVRMLRARLKKEGIDAVVGKARFWDVPAAKFDAGPTVEFEASYDDTDEQPWVLLRFTDGKIAGYMRRQYDDDKSLIEDALNGEWERKK